jgi:hypothetical protein
MGTAGTPNLGQQNAIARAMIQQSSVEMTQNIFSTTVVPASQNVINVIPRNVGLIKGFYIEVAATITNTSGSGLTLTDFNAANILSQITFTDLNNNVRINTTGWHLDFLATAKQQQVWGASFASDSPIKYGSNWSVISAPATIAASGTGTVLMKYWVPLAYSDMDYRGAVYANVVQATMLLQLTINPTPVVSSGDSTTAVYTGNPATNTSTTINVYQVYMDQIPQGKGGPVLPVLDLATIYELKFSTLTGLTPGQEFPVQYSNLRDFLSTFAVYYNGTARSTGADINYLSLQSANFTNIFKVDPYLQALRTRQRIQTDFPAGTYYFDYRLRPIATTQYGNMELIVNPVTAGAGAYLTVAFEDMALTNILPQAGSLPAG